MQFEIKVSHVQMLLGVWILLPVVMAAQTANDLAKKYPSITTYQVRPGIVMFAKFDDGGQVCEVKLRRAQERGSDVHVVFSDKLADQLIDEIVPVSQRGRASEWLNPASIVTGGMFFIKQDYENISVETLGADHDPDGLQEVKIIWTKRKCK